eukprot:607510_1
MSEPITWFPAISCFLTYACFIVFGQVRDLLSRLFGKNVYFEKTGYAPLLSGPESFYTRRCYQRIEDAWNRPIASCPGAEISVMERDLGNKLRLTGKLINCMNLGSYNYLGFAEPNSSFQDALLKSLDRYSITSCSYRSTCGSTQLHTELEELVARFLEKPACMIFGMGFGTNSTGIPFLVRKGDLVISDALNHSSIIVGCRTSGAKIRVFKHNDIQDLEKVIRSSILYGQPKSRRPWKKIIIIVEGVYSMEGHTCDLAPIVALKKIYKCYLYIDEAHSIGALGETGRGICEHTGVPFQDVDMLMGTFTKSFGACGGYIAGSERLIQWMRRKCAGSLLSASIPPVCLQQIISSMRVIMGEDGTDDGMYRLQALKENSNYFRKRLISFGCHVMGNEDSPVVPMLLVVPAKLASFSRLCLEYNLAVVVVGFPATSPMGARVRFCISSSHTREMLDDALEKLFIVIKRSRVQYQKEIEREML